MDVGAGIGTEVLTFADLVGETGWVHAIEAHPQTFRDLKLLVDRNIGRSIAANMTLDRYAAWGSNEPIRMSDGDEHIANSVGVGAGFNVEGITLDEFVQRRSIDRINLLKMNIEGAELHALAPDAAGAALAITRNAVISCHDFLADRGGDDVLRTKDAVRSHLLSAGFTVVERQEHPDAWVRALPLRIEGLNRHNPLGL